MFATVTFSMLNRYSSSCDSKLRLANAFLATDMAVEGPPEAATVAELAKDLVEAVSSSLDSGLAIMLLLQTVLLPHTLVAQHAGCADVYFFMMRKCLGSVWFFM